MPPVGVCPDVTLIQQLAARKLSGADQESVLAHVERCAACAQKLKALGEAPGISDQQTLRPREPVRTPRLQATCAGCGKGIKVNPELAGKKIKCPHCKQAVHVPPGAAAARSGEPETQLPANPGVATCTYPALKAHYDFLAAAQAPDELGRLGPYRVLEVLGAGGMGVVFRAEDPQLVRLVALKAMLPALAASDSARQRFLREARAAAALKHDHIVTIHQVSEDRGVPFLAMEFLEGEPLDARLEREGKLPVAEVLRLGIEIALALSAAHQRELIHRDIKPANIWLEARLGEPGASATGGRVKLLDFGLARAVTEGGQLTQEAAIVGTPAYMAPEQAQGKSLDARCDLFSLGCVLYRMATGKPAFKGSDMVSTLMAVATEEPPTPVSLNHELPIKLSKLIVALLAKEPAERPPSAQAVVAELQDIAAALARQRVLPAKPVRAPVTQHTPALKRPIVVGVVGGLLFLMVVGLCAVGMVLRRQPRDDTIVAEDVPADPGEQKTAPLPQTDDDGFEPIFNGKDLAGWFVENGDKQSWDVANGEIIAWGKDGKTRNYLLSERVYADFRLRLEFNLAKGALSGVALRALRGETMPHADHKMPVNDHPQFKLLEPRTNEETGTTHGVLNTAYVAPGQSAELKAPGDWNRVELEVKGRSLRAWVNGKEVTNTSLAPGSLLADGSVPGLNRSRGRIGLLKQVGIARFRNIAIKELPAEPGVGAGGGPQQGFPVIIAERQRAKWRIANGCLEQTSKSENVMLSFGDPTWSHYDFSLEFRRAQGDCWLLFHLQLEPDWRKNRQCLFGVCAEDNRVQHLQGSIDEKWQAYASKNGPLGNTWMRARVSVRGSRAQCFLNEQKLFDCNVAPHAAGLVGLRTWGGAYQFRNIKVTDPSGKVQLEGLPDLDSAWSADARAASAAGFVPIFNGKHRSGWTVGSGDLDARDRN